MIMPTIYVNYNINGGHFIKYVINDIISLTKTTCCECMNKLKKSNNFIFAYENAH